MRTSQTAVRCGRRIVNANHEPVVRKGLNALATKPFVGLLISPTSIEAVQCSKNDAGEISFDFYHQLAVSEPYVDEDGDLTDAEGLGRALAQFWKDTGIQCRQVVLGVSGKRAIARMVSLPAIPANQLMQVVLSEAEQYTLFRDEEPLVDYFTIDKDQENCTLFYAAVSQKLANAYKGAMSKAKLHLKAIDIAQYASLRALVHFKLSDADMWDGVVVQPTQLVITSWFGQKLLNWREVSSERFVDEDAEQGYQFIETEISRTLRPDPASPREILLAKGTLAESGQMSDYFQRNTDLPLQAAGVDYWCRRMPPEALTHITPAALGLALWGLEERIPHLDLLNRSSKSDTLAALQAQFASLKMDRAAGIAVGLAIGTFAAGFGGLWYYGANVVGTENTQLTAQNSQLTSAIAGLNLRAAELKQATDANEQVLKLIGAQARTNLAVSFMTQVDEVIPADAWLTAVEAPNPETMVVKGGATTQSAGLAFARKITEFIEVQEVKVDDMSRIEPGRYEFTIHVAIKPESVDGLASAPTVPGTPGGGAGQ